MENWIYASSGLLLKVIISIFVIFAVIIALTRISGLRTFAKMTAFDFASTIAIGSILASVVMNSGQSLLKGSLALAGIIAFQFFFSKMLQKTEWFGKLFTNKPLLLMRHGEVLFENLKKSNLTENDLYGKLREANVIEFSEVKAVILESTGDVSVLHSGGDEEVDDRLLRDVRS